MQDRIASEEVHLNPRFTDRFKWLWTLSPPAACISVCALATALVFVSPYAVPVMFRPVISASYMAGFNNRAAAIAAAGISFTVALWGVLRHRDSSELAPGEATFSNDLGWRTIYSAVLLTCLFAGSSAWAIDKAGQRYIADAGYFIEQMTTHVEFGKKLYNQLEFAYGPLLFYPTVWLQQLLRCRMFTAYFLTYAIEQSLGLVELGYILNSLPLRKSLRQIAFVLFAIGAVNPLLGLNYTLFRYLTPLALLIAIAKVRNPLRCAIACTICQMISLGVSAEIGFAFAFAAFALLLYKATALGPVWLLALLGPVVGFSVFFASVGRPYFHMLTAFAGGALNLPMAPYPHVLVFLFAVIWMSPLAVSAFVRHRNETACIMVAWYGFGIALLPSALGRCDPLHVFFVGAPLCLISLVAASAASRALRNTWTICLVTLVLWQIVSTNRLFRFRTADTLSAVLPSRITNSISNSLGVGSALGGHMMPVAESDDSLDIPQLERWVGRSSVATPFEITVKDENALKRARHYQPSYYAFMVDTFSASAEQRKIQEINQRDWALVPATYDLPFIEMPRTLQDLQGMSYPLPERHPVPFRAGAAMAENLRVNWTEIDENGPYRLLKRDGPLPTGKLAIAPDATSPVD